MKKYIYLSVMAFALLACAKEEGMKQNDEIQLTTPVLELNAVSSIVTRSGGAEFDGAELMLYIHDSEDRVLGRKGVYTYDGTSWTTNPSVTLLKGPGNYRAGALATVDLAASGDIPVIQSAYYGHRGSISVTIEGEFTPSAAMQPLSSAVRFTLKNHEGTAIEPEEGTYMIEPVGLAKIGSYDESGYPNGNGNFAPSAKDSEMIDALDAHGDFMCGTYPATWENGSFTAAAVPTEAWTIFKVTYCAKGFNEQNEPLGAYFVWNVTYPAEQFTMKAGTLYNFTIKLGDPAATTKSGEANLSAEATLSAEASLS